MPRHYHSQSTFEILICMVRYLIRDGEVKQAILAVYDLDLIHRFDNVMGSKMRDLLPLVRSANSDYYRSGSDCSLDAGWGILKNDRTFWVHTKVSCCK